MAKKTWREKYDVPGKNLPRVEIVTGRAAKIFGGNRVLIATPKLVDAVIRRIKKGRLITINQIRERLARDFRADTTCPITTGIFVRIISEVAEEERALQKRSAPSAAAKKSISPYWRVLKSGGKLNEKYPGGLDAHARKLRAEGHAILRSKNGKLASVGNYEKKLQTL